MKYFIIFLAICYLNSGCHATLGRLGRLGTIGRLFGGSSSILEPEVEDTPLTGNPLADFTPEDVLLFSNIFNTNGFGYLRNNLASQEYLNELGFPLLRRYLPILRSLPNSFFNSEENTEPFGLSSFLDPDVSRFPFLPALPTVLSQFFVPQNRLQADNEESEENDESRTDTEEETPTSYVQQTPTVFVQNVPSESILALPDDGIPIDFQNQLPNTVVFQPLDGNKGDYFHSYVLSDGTKVFEQGRLVRGSTGKDVIVKSGYYEYVNDVGETVKVNWIADELGFRVVN